VGTPHIIFEDGHIVAVSKPEGLLVHRTRIASDKGPFLLQQVRDMTGRYLYPVHRLDKPTSGIVIFAAALESARTLSESFRNHAVRKTYLAVVRGWVDEKGQIDSPLDKPADGNIGKPDSGQVAKKEALTNYIRLAKTDIPYAVSRHPTSRYSLVKVHPLTGRRHQIRRHLRRISHPVVGDVEYGDGRHNRFFRSHFGIRRLLLHACSITILHPHTGIPFTITDPPGPDFRKVCNELGWEIPEKFETHEFRIPGFHNTSCAVIT
jgi:tRNA pseudouridine65 synthase